jgi:hypothetical protein
VDLDAGRTLAGALERDLGVRLFARTARRPARTARQPAGS